MTRRDTEIKRIQSGTEYGPMPYGMFSGEPTVSVKLSSNEHNSIKVNSLENLFLNRNWKRKVSSGYARLRIYGDDPFSEDHRESLEYLIDVLDPRFIDFEVEDRFINKQPSTYIQRKIDTYSFFIDLTKDEKRYDDESLQYLSDNNASHGNVQYIFKVDSVTQEDDIKDFRREFGVYDSEIWLFPKGRKASTVFKNRNTITNFAKRNKWNVSPRLDIDLEEE